LRMGYYSYRGDTPRRDSHENRLGKGAPILFRCCLRASPVQTQTLSEGKSKLCVGAAPLLRTALRPKHSLRKTAPTKTCVSTRLLYAVLRVLCVWPLCGRPLLPRFAPCKTDRVAMQSCRLNPCSVKLWLKRNRYLIVAAFQGNFS